MIKRLHQHQPLSTDIASLVLRLLFGGLFIYHGYTKIGLFNEYAPNFLDIGIGAKASFMLVIFAEFFCGILVTIGLFTRFAVVPIFITMVVAYFIAHSQHAFNQKETPFIFLLLSIVIFVLGSGRFSIDEVIQNSRERKRK